MSRPLVLVVEDEADIRELVSYNLAKADFEETNTLAEAMNRMAAQLDERIRTIQRQQNELEAVLGSMEEGVLAVDNDRVIINVNQTCADLMDGTLDDRENAERFLKIISRQANRLDTIIEDPAAPPPGLAPPQGPSRRNGWVFHATSSTPPCASISIEKKPISTGTAGSR